MSENIDKIIEKVKSNNAEENKQLAQQLQSGLTAEQQNSLQKILSDSEALNKILNAEPVKKILEKFSGDKNGHK